MNFVEIVDLIVNLGKIVYISVQAELFINFFYTFLTEKVWIPYFILITGILLFLSVRYTYIVMEHDKKQSKISLKRLWIIDTLAILWFLLLTLFLVCNQKHIFLLRKEVEGIKNELKIASDALVVIKSSLDRCTTIRYEMKEKFKAKEKVLKETVSHLEIRKNLQNENIKNLVIENNQVRGLVTQHEELSKLKDQRLNFKDELLQSYEEEKVESKKEWEKKEKNLIKGSQVRERRAFQAYMDQAAELNACLLRKKEEVGETLDGSGHIPTG